MAQIKIKRIYESASPDDGFRLLVDRLWARGISKEKAEIDLWLKDIAPSNELRKWYQHDPEKWAEFKKRYIQELSLQPAARAKLEEILNNNKIVTFLFSSTNLTLNNAVALKEHCLLE